MGFGAEIKAADPEQNEKLLAEVTHHDLVRYGLIPELCGRLPVVTALKQLNEDDMVRIMTEPKNSVVSQYKALFAMDDVELEFEPEALKAIAVKTAERKTGARGLRSIMEEYLTDLMFEIPGDDSVKRIVITADFIEGKGQPKIVRNVAKAKAAATAKKSAKDGAVTA